MADLKKTQTLDQLYTETINMQRDHLAALQEDFNRLCDQIAVKTENKIKEVPKKDKKTRQKIYNEQKEELDRALNKLKRDVDESSKKTRKKLEEINALRESKELKELEDLIQNIEA